MAAVYYTYDTGRDIFKSGITFSNVVRIFGSNGGDFFAGLINGPGMAIVTSVQVNNSDIIQYFMTFDDVISYFYFGKGLGTMTISGMLFTNCDGNMPGVGRLYSRIAANRGREIVISLGGATFKGVISNFSTTTVADPEPVTEFQITVSMISHSLGSSRNFQSTC